MATVAILGVAMKTLSARDAKNRFGEFLDMARREPVLVTKNDRPVGVFLSIEDAAETLVPDRFMDPSRVTRPGLPRKSAPHWPTSKAARPVCMTTTPP